MNISFEFFPPKTEQDKQALKQVWQELEAVKPLYFSVTFGALGSAQNPTSDTIINIQKNTKTPACPHISCINSAKPKIIQMLDKYQASGIKNLVVLRGDIPDEASNTGDFHYAYQLVEFIKKNYSDHFHLKVAAYPEKHPESPNIKTDLTHFANKIKSGADEAITQYFYNPDAYFRFLDEVQALGITTPITPGILPITNYKQLTNFSQKCGAEIPKWILTRLESYQNDLPSIRKFGQEVVQNLTQTLKNQGINNFHFYSMNRTTPSLEITKHLIN